MENGVKIIIERLKTNPEEFEDRGNRWINIVRAYKDFMTEEDRVAIENALRPLVMEKMNADVLNTLMRTEKEQMELDFGNAPVKKDGTPVSYTLTLGNK